MQDFHDLQRIGRWLLLALGLSSCSKDYLEVQYPQMISPSEAFTELKKLAVGLDPKLDPELRELVVRSLKKCSLFADIQIMDKPVRVSGSNPKDYFEALIKRSPAAQASQGMLSLQIEDDSQGSSLEKSQAILVEDKDENDWYPSFGLPVQGTLGLPSRPEMAPLVKNKRRETYIRTDKTQYIVRLVVYNRVAGKIVQDRLVSSVSSLHNYSRKPSLKKAKFVRLVQRSVIDEVLFHACPAKDIVKRKLYYAKTLDEPAKAINEGVDLVDEERWSLAATKWNNVLIKDPKNGLAHHNLGIHLERQGEFFKALEHFKAANQSRQSSLLLENDYEQIQTAYMPRLGGSSIYPQIAFVTGGGWAYVRADKISHPEGRQASIYRLEPVVNQESSRISGLALREVGVLRTFGAQDGFYPGRIKEYLLDTPVKAGDFLLSE